MKSMISLTTVREIKSSWGRFLAILLIVALGVGFFSGLMVTDSAMRASMTDYLNELQFYDFRLISTLGFEQEDVDTLAGVPGARAVEGARSVDMVVDLAGSERVLKLLSITTSVNTPALSAGRLPENDHEIVLDSYYYDESRIGAKVTLSADNADEDLEKLSAREFTVVGLARSPLYIQYERGSTSLGDGTLDGFAYLLPEAFTMDYFTEVYVRLDQDLLLYSDEYNDLIDSSTETWENALEKVALDRYDRIVADATAELETAQADFEAQKADGQAELDEAAAQLSDAQTELQDGKTALDDAAAELDENAGKLEDAEAELESGQQSLTDGAETLAESKTELEDAETELASGRAELNSAEATLAASRSRLDAAEQQLESAKAMLDETAAQLEEAKAELDAAAPQLAEGEAQLTATKTQLDDSAAELAAAKTQLDQAASALNVLEALLEAAKAAYDRIPTEGAAALVAGLQARLDTATAEYEEGLAAYNAGLAAWTEGNAQYEAALQAYNDQYAQYEVGLAEYEAGQGQYEAGLAEYETAKAEYDSGLQQYYAGYAEYLAGLAEYETGEAAYETGLAQYNEGLSEYNDAQAEYEQGLADYNEGVQALADGREAYDEAAAEYESGLSEYADGQAEYEQGLQEFTDAVSEGEQALADAQAEIDAIEMPDTYVLTRSTNLGYSCFESDSGIMGAIAKVFPIFFFLVAALVCMTTMGRMVEDERTQIGVLKALGYSSWAVMRKFVVYSGLAALLGAVLGYLVGTIAFPKAIWMAYCMMYDTGGISYYFSLPLLLISLLVAMLCSVGVTILTCRVELGEMAASLMRPKAPKAGKRIFLEYVPFLWNRLSFLKKISLRNIFRYKGRLVMMILGIGGCTALLATGFGLKDSIADIAESQYGQISLYDAAVTLAEVQDESAPALTELGYSGEDYVLYYETTVDLVMESGSKNMYLRVFSDDTQLDGFFDLHTVSGEALALPGKDQVIVNAGIARQYGLSVGDTVTISSDTFTPFEVVVSGINENFIYNYIYLTESTYTAHTGAAPENKSAFVNFADGVDPHEAGAELSASDDVASIMLSADMLSRVSKMMQSLNIVVYLVLLCAAALCFVVVYNLTNINITERVREIATIKVLGFYKGETASYVFRENLLLSVMGGILGLGLGKLLHSYVMSRIVIDMVSFDIRILPVSYCYSFALTIVFTFLVNLVMTGKLEAISMTESLKAVE